MHRYVRRFLVSIAAVLFAFCYAQESIRQIEVPGLPGLQLTLEQGPTPTDNLSERLENLIAQYEAKLGRSPSSPPPKLSHGDVGTFAVASRQFANDRKITHVFITSDHGPGVCHLEGPTLRVLAGLKAVFQSCGEELKRQTASATAGSTLPPVPSGRQAPAQPSVNRSGSNFGSALPLHPENWSLVDGVYFESTTGFGVGGMVTIEYQPVVCFRDGTYFEVDDAALEDLDLSAKKASKPKQWGRWRRSGETFDLTDYRGRSVTSKLQDGRFFKAFSAEDGGNRLSGEFERVSGGGNTALGGDSMISLVSHMRFTENGSFSTDKFVGSTNSGEHTGVSTVVGSSRKMAVPGTYEIKHHTITLRYPDGTVKRNFFAFSSRGTPPAIDRHMMFFGDRPWITETATSHRR